MKNQIIGMAIAAISFTSFGAYAQVHVPQMAKEAFMKAYPQVHNPKWETENGNFEGNWKEGGYDHSAMFSPSGKFVGSETDISPEKLPQMAKNYMTKNVHAKVKEASLNKDANGTTTFEADVKGKAYIFDKNGQFLKIGEDD
ncbi:hypothetical protein [Arachidicoccus soli]|uniref:Beta-lactamase-inhibitor-like PepSY-like domain-containing protein n=1 Tax=Arachidicoccus soli TaxID=2341117 RepID=A0A386HMD1_9BACT|nr:hypothetical protein [Arachidicoccus soli]AYD47057.1 hypothetical protein D6B99_05180 [Arachidicoccus soli]